MTIQFRIIDQSQFSLSCLKYLKGCDQVSDHIANHSLLTPCQSGFRKGFSTQNVLVYVTDIWKRAIDQREFVGCVFLDLKKAFDCVDHKI